MNYISWNAEGVNIYLEESVIFLTYSQLSMYIVVLGLCVGLLIGVVVSYITRIYSHRAVKALIFEGCLSPDTAKRLDELNTRSKKQIRSMLKTGKHLRRTVLCANEDEFPVKQPSALKKFWYNKFLGREIPRKTDFSVARFYIPEEKRIGAEVRYSREGMSPAALVITLIVIVGVAIAALYVIPDLLQMAENIFG